MADLLSNTDKVSFQNSVLDLFETFSRKITVHKDPQKKITSVDAHLLPGYEGTDNRGNITFVPKSETFDAIISYNRKQGTEAESFAGISIPMGEVRLKVEKTTKDYINNGKTIRIDFDEKSFKLVSSDSVKDYFGMKMYVYYVEEIS